MARISRSKICEWCAKEFLTQVKKVRFCSRACAAAYTAKIKLQRTKQKTCPICGDMNYRQEDLCSKCRPKKIHEEGLLFHTCPECGHQGYRKSEYCKKHGGYHVLWTEPEDKIVLAEYATVGAEGLLAKLPGRKYTQIRDRAYRLGIVLNPDTYRATVHGAASEYLRAHNPSKQPGAEARLRRQGKEIWRRPNVVSKILEGHRKLQKNTPTKLEKKMFQILDDLGIAYEPYAIIKPKFIVDARIGTTIIQADGDWWHGHPRFEPLIDRQIAQRKRDAAQDAYLSRCGYTVIRIWERDMSIETVRARLQHVGLSLPFCAEPIT